jgi:uncharacterized protein (UPF0548 family)
VLTRSRPDDRELEALLARQSASGFSYPVGLTGRPPPPRWFVDDVQHVVGHGTETFDAACAALRGWDQVDLGWFAVFRPDNIALRPGEAFAFSARTAGVWWTYCLRIVEVIDETHHDGGRRFGFAHGTIGSHAVRGEEQFVVALDGTSGEVRASIVAISRPARWFSYVGLPLVRRAQLRFKREALAALERAARSRRPG